MTGRVLPFEPVFAMIGLLSMLIMAFVLLACIGLWARDALYDWRDRRPARNFVEVAHETARHRPDAPPVRQAGDISGVDTDLTLHGNAFVQAPRTWSPTVYSGGAAPAAGSALSPYWMDRTAPSLQLVSPPGDTASAGPPHRPYYVADLADARSEREWAQTGGVAEPFPNPPAETW